MLAMFLKSISATFGLAIIAGFGIESSCFLYYSRSESVSSRTQRLFHNSSSFVDRSSNLLQSISARMMAEPCVLQRKDSDKVVNLMIASGDVTQRLIRKSVQEELGLTKADIEKIEVWIVEFYPKTVEIKKNMGMEEGGVLAVKNGQTLDEAIMRRNSARVEIRSAAYKELGNILSKAQIERLKQINLQKLRIIAFMDDEVILTLNLSDTQKSKMKELFIEREKAFNTRDIPSDEDFLKLQKLEKENTEKAVALLTEEQKKKWKEMVGKSLDLEKPVIPKSPKAKD